MYFFLKSILWAELSIECLQKERSSSLGLKEPLANCFPNLCIDLSKDQLSFVKNSQVGFLVDTMLDLVSSAISLHGFFMTLIVKNSYARMFVLQ